MDLFTTKEVAELVGVTYGRVCQLIWEGKLEAKKYGRDWMITREELIRWQKSQTTEESPENTNAKH